MLYAKLFLRVKRSFRFTATLRFPGCGALCVKICDTSLQCLNCTRHRGYFATLCFFFLTESIEGPRWTLPEVQNAWWVIEYKEESFKGADPRNQNNTRNGRSSTEYQGTPGCRAYLANQNERTKSTRHYRVFGSISNSIRLCVIGCLEFVVHQYWHQFFLRKNRRLWRLTFYFLGASEPRLQFRPQRKLDYGLEWVVVHWHFRD